MAKRPKLTNEEMWRRADIVEYKMRLRNVPRGSDEFERCIQRLRELGCPEREIQDEVRHR